ncbi:MAG TPA: hypothetical protein VFW05_05665 [Verrucomicrobiae bacterium]|nr:hypothetical protein [Verrucomicrobiae bacterium]
MMRSNSDVPAIAGKKSGRKVREGLAARRRSTEKMKAAALRQAGAIKKNKTILSAIKNKEVLRFTYNGKERVVEPQTYGISIAGHEVLRAFQKGGGSRSGQTKIAKLFDVEKISSLEKTGEKFSRALPEHNPQDSAMAEVFASLPRPARNR